MRNEYDIDDILSEIKERKSREKGREDTKTPPLAPASVTRETDEKELYRTTFDALDDMLDSKAAEVKPFGERQRPTRGAGSAPEEPQRKAAKPDKLEFSSERSRDFSPDFFEQPEVPKAAPINPSTEGPAKTGDASFDFEAFDEIAPLGQGRRTRREQQKPAGEESPLQFGSHAKSIADKAQQRSHYADLADKSKPTPQRPPKSKLQFHVEEPAGASPDTMDFATMIERSVQQTTNAAGTIEGTAQTTEGVGTVRSRSGRFSTPADATGKSLKIEDIQRLDFGAVDGAGTRAHDLFYEDTPDDGVQDGSFTSFREFRPSTARGDIALEIARTKVWMFVRTSITALLTVLLFVFSLAGADKFGWIPMPKSINPVGETMKSYILVLTILTGIILLVNIKEVAISIFNLFRMRANSQTLASLAVMAAVLQGVYATTHMDVVDANKLNLYFAVAALTMLFTGIGRLSVIGRIQANFRIVSSKLAKKGVQAAESSGFCYDVTLDESATKPTVAYAGYADFFSDFVALSFSDKYDVGINRSVAPVCLLGSIIVAFGAGAGDMFSALSALTACLAICATLSVTFIESIPLGKLAKRLTPYGCMVSGNKAVEKFCDTHSVILNDTDLFPEKNMTLHGIKAFAGARLDEVILEAASVLTEVNGSLSPLFLDMIGGDRHLLKKVDDIVYESGMGISAWIDKKRVLIGNRMLMTNHGVMLPNDTYERENPGDPPGNPIYISNSGEVSARFLVNYNIDEELAYQLDQLGAQNRNLVVYTTDANINEQTIWELYGYPLELITVLPSDLHEEYREMAAPQQDLPAEIVYTGGAANFIAAILGTVSARSSILSATIIQLAQIILGYGLIAFMAFMGYIGGLSILEIALYQGFWLVAILIIQQIRKT